MPNDGLPMSEQLSMFLHQTTQTSSFSSNDNQFASLNQSLFVPIFLLAFLVIVDYLLYDNRQEQKKFQYGQKVNKLQPSIDTQFNREKVVLLCPTCHSKINSDDIFCQICGEKVV